MSKTSLNQPSLPTWILERAVRAGSRFSAVRRDKGTIAAIFFVASCLVRLAKRSLRQSGQLQDYVALLPLPNLFMRHDVLFIGYLEAGLGLGESLRGLVRSVAATSLPFALYPFNLGVETRLLGTFMQDLYDMKHRHRVNVMEMAADQVPAMLAELGRWKTGHSYNILRTYWELSEAPAEWASMLSKIHELWAPTQFVADAFREIFGGTIALVPPCVDVERNEIFDKSHFGLSQALFYYMFSFDYFSHPARKNPLAVLHAFQHAFPDPTEKVGLVIKATGETSQHLEIKSALLAAARVDRRIKILDQLMPRDEMLSLISECDCYVSLHRAEGFGLGMAEALAFGKSVIATDYSGSTDFLSECTGFPIPYTIRPVHEGEYVFAAGKCWAEPDGAAAVEAMRRVFYDQAERQSRAAAGKALVQTRYGRKNVGRIAAQRLRDLLAERNLFAKI